MKTLSIAFLLAAAPTLSAQQFIDALTSERFPRGRSSSQVLLVDVEETAIWM